jgi:hypothetical protein
LINDGASCDPPCLVKSKERGRLNVGAAERVGSEHVVEDVTVDAEEQMLEKLDNGSRIRDASQRCCASAASALNVLSETRESGKQKFAEFVCEEGTVSFCDSSEGESIPRLEICHVGMFRGIWTG